MFKHLHIKFALLILFMSLCLDILVTILDSSFFPQGIISIISTNIIVALFAGFIIYNILIKRIKEFNSRIDHAASGNYNIKLGNAGTDELGKFYKSTGNLIENMADEIAMAKSFQTGINSAFFITDRESNILAANDAVCRLMKLNLTPQEIIRKKMKVKDIFLQDHLTKKAFNGEYIKGMPAQMKDHTGHLFSTVVQTGPVYNRKNEVVAVYGFFENLQELEQKQKEYLHEQIKPIAEALNQVSEGNLTSFADIDKDSDLYQLGQNLNKMIGELNTVLNQVHEAVQATASAANEISSSSEQMAAGAQEQSQQTTEVASAVEEMTKTILEGTRNASLASEQSTKASEITNLGAKTVNQTKDVIEKIVEAAQVTAVNVKSLASKTDQIGEIAMIIDEIADQTNLLALNAAIEAARAGEQGRGFAVVADEVRKLAERTTKATKEIADTIKAIQTEANEANIQMQKAGSIVMDGMKYTNETAEALKEIISATSKVSDIVAQVAAGSEEQSAAAEQISKNVEGISSVTQQSAAGTEQIARAAEDLNRLTVNLQDLVSRFKLRKNDNKYKEQSSLNMNNSRSRKPSKVTLN